MTKAQELLQLCGEAKVKLPKGGLEGTIVKVDTHQGLDTYTLDNGYTWGDSAGRHKKGDRVKVTPYIMGTVSVQKVNT